MDKAKEQFAPKSASLTVGAIPNSGGMWHDRYTRHFSSFCHTAALI
jgi:hypothetical protein